MAAPRAANAEPPALSAALAADINASFPRPASVFQLAGAAPSGGRFVLPDVALRKVVKRPIFEVTTAARQLPERWQRVL